jgi:putative ABC transport system permease protein
VTVLWHVTRPLRLGLKSLLLHKLRSGLTTLGIVFGVASVISMLAIGEGASREQQRMFEKLGATNIIFRSIKPPSKESASAGTSFVLKYGLTYADQERIEMIPTVTSVVAQRELQTEVRHLKSKVEIRVVGTTPDYARFHKIGILQGRWLEPDDERTLSTVCVLGSDVARKLFPLTSPVGDTVRLKGDYYRVIGVLDGREVHETAGASKLTQDFNLDVYIPLETCKKRFGELLVRRSSGNFQAERIQLHQITVAVDSTDNVVRTGEAINSMLDRYHEDGDYRDIVPLQLLRQAEQTKRIFMTVLGSIASISLLVGGIGIMNIMLATVTERTREIGIRRALGARRRDITAQFLIETVVLAGLGGLLGTGLGIAIPLAVDHFFGMETVITGWSLGLAIGISCLVGIVFGLYPARRAASMDPIEALRHE